MSGRFMGLFEFIKLWIRRFLVGTTDVNAEISPTVVRQRLLRVFAIMTVVAGTPYCVIFWWMFGETLPGLMILAAAVLTGATLPVLDWTGSTRVAANWLSLVVYGAVVGVSTMTGGVHAPSIYWASAVPIYPLVFSGINWGLGWTVLCVGTYVGFYVAPYLNIPIYNVLGSAEHQMLMMFGLAGLTFLFFLLFSTHRSMLQFLEQKQKQLEYRACYDPLTDLPNRLEFQKQLRAALQDFVKGQNWVAMGVVDIDRFSSVNESLGTAAGDDLLVETGKRLEQWGGQDAMVGRLGGDKFVVLFESKESPELEDFGERLKRIFEVPFFIGHSEVQVTASAGFASPPSNIGSQSETSAKAIGDALTRTADRALQDAKKAPGTSWRVFDPSTWGEASRTLEREMELREAIDNKEFIPFFQPVVDLENLEIIGFEVLARWDHPERGIVSPGDFLPLAERMDLMGQLGDMVLEQTCNVFRSLDPEVLTDRNLKVFVNLSPKQIDRADSLEDLLGVLDRLAPAGLQFCFEITEAEVLNFQGRIQRIRRAGYEVAIDDFGTGYSSMARLRNIEVDGLKLDMEFVKNIPGSKTNAAIARTVIELGRRLELSVVGEGVESEKQLQFLTEAGCNFAQGYYLARPGRLGSFFEESGVHSQILKEVAN